MKVQAAQGESHTETQQTGLRRVPGPGARLHSPLSGRGGRESEGRRASGGNQPGGGLPASHWGLGALRSLPWPPGLRTQRAPPRAAEDLARVRRCGRPLSESGGHRHGQCEEAPFPLSLPVTTEQLQEDLPSATGSRSPALEKPWGGRQGPRWSRCPGRPGHSEGQDTREPREDGKTRGQGEGLSAEHTTQGRERPEPREPPAPSRAAQNGGRGARPRE